VWEGGEGGGARDGGVYGIMCLSLAKKERAFVE